MNGLEKLNKARLVLAVLVLGVVAINGLLYYRYQALLANPPSPEFSADVATDEDAEDLSEQQRPPQAVLVGAGT
jgi:hypothetical protein